ncbi:MAG: ABC transporter substrate-binding protein [Planctomycetaceae bacterium]|jgi:iron complex transport system substrate-binding protein|nr:ABC transporter substrate-binding protein [Planctomycetaceae bacterium]
MPKITELFKYGIDLTIRRQLFFYVINWIIFVTIITGCENQNHPNLPQNNQTPQSPERIISITPAATELLFELGLGDKIVGDSQFTIYPPEAAKIEKIGGLYDRNIEKIITLKPDLIIYPVEDVQFGQKLESMNIRRLAVDHRSISGLLQSYNLVGEFFGGEYLERALAKRRAIEDFLSECKIQTNNLQRLRVLMVIDRQHGTGRIDNVYIAGTELFFGEILDYAGGENVAANAGIPYPNVSTEAIIDFNPDVIIEIQANPKNNAAYYNSRNDWNSLKEHIPAIKKSNLFIINDNYATIPGPRITLLIERIKTILDQCRKNP